MGRQRRFCNCRLWRLQQPCVERLCFDEGFRRRRRRHGCLRTDEACEELRVPSIDSPTLHGGLERLNCGRFCALTFELSGAVGVRLNEGLGRTWREGHEMRTMKPILQGKMQALTLWLCLELLFLNCLILALTSLSLVGARDLRLELNLLATRIAALEGAREPPTQPQLERARK